MLNLIRKDFLLQIKTIMLLLPFLLIYVLMGAPTIFAGVLFSIAIIMNAFSYDEKPTINILLNSLPYTRKEIVSSKYIGVLIFTFIVVFTVFIGNLIFHRELVSWKDSFLIFGFTMVLISLMFPFSYKFKSNYLLVASLIFFVIYIAVVNLFVKNLNDQIREFVQMLLTLQSNQLYMLLALLVIAIYIGSWLLSIRIYKNKVF